MGNTFYFLKKSWSVVVFSHQGKLNLSTKNSTKISITIYKSTKLVKGSPIFTLRKHKHSCKEKHSPKQRRFLSLKLEQSFRKEISITFADTYKSQDNLS